MVAEEGEERAAGAGSIELEFLEEVEEFDLVGASVKDVADLDGNGVSADPTVGIVDEAGEGEGLLGLLEVTVEVANGDESGRGRIAGLG